MLVVAAVVSGVLEPQARLEQVLTARWPALVLVGELRRQERALVRVVAEA